MIVHRATCGLCKPGKKWKKNATKLKRKIERAISEDELTGSFIKSYINKL